MCNIYRIQDIIKLKCNDCTIEINTKGNETSRPRGYILIIDGVLFPLFTINECKALHENLIGLNNPQVNNVIKVLKEFLLRNEIIL